MNVDEDVPFRCLLIASGLAFNTLNNNIDQIREISRIHNTSINQLYELSNMITESKLIDEFLPEVENTSILVQEITAASQEQQSAVQQVNNSIQQMNEVTQQNASSSEKLANNSQNLSQKAEELKEAVRYFQTNSYNNQ